MFILMKVACPKHNKFRNFKKIPSVLNAKRKPLTPIFFKRMKKKRIFSQFSNVAKCKIFLKILYRRFLKKILNVKQWSKILGLF